MKTETTVNVSREALAEVIARCECFCVDPDLYRERALRDPRELKPCARCQLAVLASAEQPEYSEAELNCRGCFGPCGQCEQPPAHDDECPSVESWSLACNCPAGAKAEQPGDVGRDVHPEDFCDKCGGPNICWFAPNEIWNKVVSDRYSILCPICFAKLAEEAGFTAAWQVSQERATPPQEPTLNEALAKACELEDIHIDIDPPPWDWRKFSKRNLRRCTSKEGFNHALESWSLSDWMTATLGELGEAANVLKKLNRERDGVPGNEKGADDLRRDFAHELADTFIYLDLLSHAAGIDLPNAVLEKFDITSAKRGYMEPVAFLNSLAPPANDEAVRLLKLAEAFAVIVSDVTDETFIIKAEHYTEPPTSRRGRTMAETYEQVERERNRLRIDLAAKDARIEELERELKITDENRNKASLRLSQMQLDMEDLRAAIEAKAQAMEKRGNRLLNSDDYADREAGRCVQECAAELRALLEPKP